MRDLPPNIFAVVMATGIVSLACQGAGESAPWRWLALGLFGFNVALFVVLWVLLFRRCLFHREAVMADLTAHAKAPGFFTLVAGTGVLGNQAVTLVGWWPAGAALWLLAVSLWAVLTYSILPWLMECEQKPPVEKGLNGAWLLAVVGTQSVCVLGCLIAPPLDDETRRPLLFAALIFWLVGGMLYTWLIAMIFHRILFLPLAPADLTPPYWINMGAMAISTLAGVSLIRNAPGLAVLADARPFLVGMTLLFWGTATWWIPMLLVLGAWRHLQQGFPLRYDPTYWGAVFPLGMYTVCTQHLIRELHVPFLAFLPAVFVWLALLAWAWAFAGLVAGCVIRPRPGPAVASQDAARRDRSEEYNPVE